MMLVHSRATNGESTQMVKRTSRKRGARRPVYSIKPIEPAAPATTAMRAEAAREFISFLRNIRIAEVVTDAHQVAGRIDQPELAGRISSGRSVRIAAEL